MPQPSALWIAPARPVLASKSASRRQLMQAVGIDVDVEAADVDERAIEHEFLAGGGALADLARQLARAKALAISRLRPGALCIGADQTLTLGDRLFHKAADRDEAAASLAALAGRTHRLTSAACVARDGQPLFEVSDDAHMTMRRLDAGQIDRYLAAAGPVVLSSVGAYQAEALGAHLFDRIDGDHATILGLPMLKLLAWFRHEGFLAI